MMRACIRQPLTDIGCCTRLHTAIEAAHAVILLPQYNMFNLWKHFACSRKCNTHTTCVRHARSLRVFSQHPLQEFVDTF